MLSLLRYLHTAAGEAWLRADVSVVRLVLCRSSLHINSELAAAAALAAWTAATCPPGAHPGHRAPDRRGLPVPRQDDVATSTQVGSYSTAAQIDLSVLFRR